MKAALALVPSSLGYWLLPLLLLSAAANARPPDSLVVVNEVRLEGNRRTREHIIRRELDVQPGDTLTVTDTAAVLRRNRNKIFNTDLFVTVDLVLKPVGAGRADLVIQLRERWYLFPSLIFELADRNFNEWWYDRNHDLNRTNYGVRLSHKNVRGRAERLRGTAQFGFTRRFEVAYEVPYLDRSLTYGLGVSFAYAQTKDLAYRSAENRLVFLDSEQQLRERWEGRLSLRRRFRFYAFHALDARFFASRIADTIAQLNPDYFLAGRTRQRYLSLGYSFTYDRRDVAAYPLHGYLINTELLRSGLLPNDDLNQWALRVRLARYGAVSQRLFWAAGLQARTLAPQRQPYSHLRALGFTQTLVRGYERYLIDGQHFALLRSSLRFQVFNTQKNFPSLIPVRQFQTVPVALYLKAHADAGYVWDRNQLPGNERLANQLLPGAGIGLDLVTFYNLVFRGEYSVNGRGERGFYLHFAADL